VAGWTTSTDFDVTSGAYQTTHGGGLYDVFVAKLNAAGNGLVYSTYLGGSYYDYGFGIAVDGSGQAYVTGWTKSANFPVTPGAYQTTYEGLRDVFVTKLSVDGRSLVYSTYLGGSGDDYGRGIAVDGSGQAYVTGPTDSPDFDITSGAYQTTNQWWDVFVVKLCCTVLRLTSAPGTDGQTICVGTAITPITYSVSGASGATVTGLPAGVSYTYAGGTVTISGTPTAAGTFTYTVTPTGGCGSATATGTITVRPNSTISLTSGAGTDNQTVQVNTPITPITYAVTDATGASVAGLPPGVTHTYASGTLTISGIPTAMGTYTYTITPTGGCGNATATGTITVTTSNSLRGGEGQAGWQIYPNPNEGAFTIYSEGGGVFELIDGAGRVLHRVKVDNRKVEVRVDVPAGLYFIREVRSGAVQKVVIER